jgi:hypothetical protein
VAQVAERGPEFKLHDNQKIKKKMLETWNPQKGKGRKFELWNTTNRVD